MAGEGVELPGAHRSDPDRGLDAARRITTYSCRFRGNTLMDISPRENGIGYPIYVREDYKAEQCPTRRVGDTWCHNSLNLKAANRTRRRAETRMIKEDWQAVKKRYEYWWAGDLVRPGAGADNEPPRAGAKPVEPWRGGKATPEQKWNLIDHSIWITEQQVMRTYYGGDALPMFNSGQSPIGMSAGAAILMGCTPHFAEATVWVDPLTPTNQYPELRINEERHRWLLDSMAKAAGRARERYFIRESFANHAGDTVALIRGTENLLLDLAESRGMG